MNLVYPAIFIPYENGTGYAVEFPDLKGCISCGDDLAQAHEMAKDAASGWILTELEDGNTIPKASNIKDIEVSKDGFTSLIVLDMDSYALKYGNKSIKKTLSIPAWMDTGVQKYGLSCSKILQDALSKILLSK